MSPGNRPPLRPTATLKRTTNKSEIPNPHLHPRGHSKRHSLGAVSIHAQYANFYMFYLALSNLYFYQLISCSSHPSPSSRPRSSQLCPSQSRSPLNAIARANARCANPKTPSGLCASLSAAQTIGRAPARYAGAGRVRCSAAASRRSRSVGTDSRTSSNSATTARRAGRTTTISTETRRTSTSASALASER